MAAGYEGFFRVDEVEGRKLIVLWAPGGQNRPYKAPEAITAKHKVWKYFIRRYSSTVEAKGETEQDLLSLAAKVSFDDRYNQSARIDDLSKPLMQAFLQEVGSTLAEDAPGLSVEALARQMNVAGGPTESPWPKNVGLLFSAGHQKLAIARTDGPSEAQLQVVGPEESASHPRAGTVGCDPAVMSEINAPSIQAQKAAIQRISQRRL